MQRVSALLPWDRSRASTGTVSTGSLHASKNSTELVRGWADKIPSPVNRLSTHKLGKDPLCPATLDKECDKAARILKSFCVDGFSTPDDRPSSPSTYSSNNSSHRLLKKIPPRIIQNAVGLAVFTSMRSGIWTTGSGGSGILVARKTDGTWSPPSGLLLQTTGLRFVFGVDIYDCVLVINNFAVLEAFARPRVTVGTDVTLTAGPLVALGLLENDVTWTDLSDRAITYIKAKGQSAEVKLDGTIISERAEENERFYGMKIGVAKILAGDINQSLPQMRPLTEVLKAAEGRTDYDAALVEQICSQPAPGDATIDSPSTGGSSPAFGLPDAEDPDPFGVLALEMAGMGIREAGTRLRPDSSQFEYNPSPTSPFFPRAGRQSVDTFLSRSNRGSYMSNKTVATERSLMTDAGTQTYFVTPQTTPSPSQSQSEDGSQFHTMEDLPEVKEPIEFDYTKIDIKALRSLSKFPDLDDEPVTTVSIKEEDEEQEEEGKEADSKKRSETLPTRDAESKSRVQVESDDSSDTDEEERGQSNTDKGDVEEEEDDDAGDESDAEEEAVVLEVAVAPAPARVAMGASRVTIPARVPPPLPARSPARASCRRSQMGDVSGLVGSPLRQQFELDAKAEGEVDEAATPRAKRSTDGHSETIEVVPARDVPRTSHETAVGAKKADDAQEEDDAEKARNTEEAEDAQAAEDAEKTGDAEKSAYPVTPIREFEGPNGYASRRDDDQTPRGGKGVTQTPPPAEEGNSLKARPNVTVSVA
ncbi:hypothetical protein GGS23DRAFT_107238 [Durotheca rogersii]|uniref:uncharacterized protein n=1 Tax=Durotheca rogersii TaxID=419775 RepID=UPI00221F65CE|nr:uncharacterized protein GGS23DRAFT_107238 [Durotheca rogersii]KAI5862131.1 hypothetical protein GGS23DRAFT_107238 [Durotheca rogersii]